MNPLSKQEAFEFIVKYTGGVQHVPLVDEARQDVLATYEDHHFLCNSDSLHWWEELWLIRGDVFAVGGEHGQAPSIVDQVISLV